VTRHTPEPEANSHPQPGSNEADPEKEATPAGVARDLEEMADDVGASTEPASDDSD
jgi:hypothetical protein